MRPPLSPPQQSQSHPDNPPSSPSSTKRPLSPSHEDAITEPTANGQDAKRRRLSSEQARGKRMFGALMGTLNSFQKQVSKDSKLAKQVERRAEIDARVKERVAKEKDEMDAVKDREEREKRESEESHRLKLEAETVSFPPLTPNSTPTFSSHNLHSAWFRLAYCRTGYKIPRNWQRRIISIPSVPLKFILDHTFFSLNRVL